MSEDPERDDGDEESPDSAASGSDASADDIDEAPTEESADDVEAEPTPDAESDSDDDASTDADADAGSETDANSDATSDTDEEPDPGSEPVTEPDLTDGDDELDVSAEAGDEESADGPSKESEQETDVDPFTVPGMSASTESEEGGDERGDDEPDIEHVDEDQVDEEAPPAEESDRTLPENQDGVGVDVPQQTVAEPDGEDDDLWGDGPESDQEMPLADHIEEMMRRLSVVFLVAGVVALTLLGLGQAFEPLPTAVELIDALWNNAIPGAPEMADRRPRLYSPLELILTKLKVAGLAGLLIGLPVFVYETYLFMRPGLYRQERRYYLAAVPTSLVLGTIGMAFAHYVIIPAIMDYFTVYTQENIASVAYGLAETFNLILVLMAYMAVVFQIPLFIMLAIMMGLTTRLWLEDKRLLFWGGFLTVAFVINPDPTGMTPFIIAATMIVLYEGTLALLRWTGN